MTNKDLTRTPIGYNDTLEQDTAVLGVSYFIREFEGEQYLNFALRGNNSTLFITQPLRIKDHNLGNVLRAVVMDENKEGSIYD